MRPSRTRAGSPVTALTSGQSTTATPSPVLAPQTSTPVVPGRRCRIISGARTSPIYRTRWSRHTTAKYAVPGRKMSLKGAVALVTGASGDIGRAIAFDLLSADAEVFMLGRSTARLSHSRPPESARERCRFVVADMTDDGAAGRIAAEVMPRGRLDVLVLSSGIYQRSQEPEVFARQIAANLLGPYALVQQLLPLLIEAQGQIVFINSTQGLRAAAGIGQFAATQH